MGSCSSIDICNEVREIAIHVTIKETNYKTIVKCLSTDTLYNFLQQLQVQITFNNAAVELIDMQIVNPQTNLFWSLAKMKLLTFNDISSLDNNNVLYFTVSVKKVYIYVYVFGSMFKLLLDNDIKDEPYNSISLLTGVKAEKQRIYTRPLYLYDQKTQRHSIVKNNVLPKDYIVKHGDEFMVEII